MSETHILLRSVTFSRNIWALNFEIPVPKNLIVSGYIPNQKVAKVDHWSAIRRYYFPMRCEGYTQNERPCFTISDYPFINKF